MKTPVVLTWHVLLLALVALPWYADAGNSGRVAAKASLSQSNPGTGGATGKGLFTLSAELERGGLSKGKNAFNLTVAGKDGKPLEGAVIGVTPWMPEHGHGVWDKPVVTELGAGKYRVENIVLIMNGKWDLRISVKKGAQEDEATLSYTVGEVATEASGDMGKPRGKYLRTIEYYKVPNVTLLNQDGEKVPLRSFLDSGKPVIVDFIFTTCTTICPILSAGIFNLRQALGEKVESVRFVSISIDPDRDRPDRLKEYLARFNAGKGWDFLTGTRQDIDLVLKAFDASVPDKMSHQPLYILHSGAKSDAWVRINGLIGTSDFLREYRLMESNQMMGGR